MLEIGDLAIHDEEAFPEERFAERVDGSGAFALAGIGAGKPSGGSDPPPGLPSESPPSGQS